jgi:glycosyltransferase involved in cell wall biosynthesis
VRILHVVEATEAGVGRHVLDLAEGLLSRGHEVHLAYSPRRADGFFRDRVSRLEGLHAWTIDLRRGPHLTDLTAVHTIRKGIRARGPFDIVHGHSSKGGAIARLSGLAAGVPAVYTPNAIRTMDPTASALTRYAVGWAERLLARVNGLVIAVSPTEAEHLARLGIPRQRLRLVPNGIREVDLPVRKEARTALGLPLDAAVVGFVGRIATQKAPDVLVSAFARVSRLHPRALLAVVGDGPLRPKLYQASERLGLRPRVRWLGEQNGQNAMPAFDLLVLPSRYEGLPLVLLEALRAGLPIVATEEASAGLVVDAGVNGLMVPLNDPDALADAILRLLTNERERAEFGLASRCRAPRFSHDRQVEKTVRTYCEAIGK